MSNSILDGKKSRLSYTNDSCGYIFNHRQIPVRITTHRDPRTIKQQSIRNNRNLVIVPRAPLVSEFKPCKAIEFCLLNARSIKNKATVLNDFVVENKIDVMAFTETWLLPGEIDGAVISDITPTGYVFRRVSRVKRGGSVAVLCKKSLKAKTNLVKRFNSFEYMDIMLESNSKSLRVVVVYRPPPSRTNGFTTELFLNEFETFLEYLAAKRSQTMIVGDFNFHVDDQSNASAVKFVKLLQIFDYTHHIVCQVWFVCR